MLTCDLAFSVHTTARLGDHIDIGDYDCVVEEIITFDEYVQQMLWSGTPLHFIFAF
jgi:hypothetical protein